jgi:hypothetical protein
MTVYTDYSAIPADNNSPPPVGAPEGMYPSTVNDTMREMMSVVRQLGDQTETSFGGLGTMASQNANNVNITGGTLKVSNATIVSTLNTSSVKTGGVTASGNSYLTTLHVSPDNGWEWTFSDDGSGNHIQQFRAGYYDLWTSSNGTRAWYCNNNLMMSLDGGGNLKVDTSLHIDPANSWGWYFYRDGATGDHYQIHVPGNDDVWRANGDREWWAFNVPAMVLDGGGNLKVHGAVTPGGVLLDVSSSSATASAKETMQTMLDSGKIDVAKALTLLMQIVLDKG